MTQRCQYIVFNKNKILLANMPNKWHFWHICHQCRNAVRTPFASFLTSTGCKRWIWKIFEFKIWKKPILVMKQTIPQEKALTFSFKMTAWVFDVLPSMTSLGSFLNNTITFRAFFWSIVCFSTSICTFQILSSGLQVCRPWVWRVGHGTPRFWQIC